MAAIPGSVPLTGKVAPTDTTDTFATHIDIYGEGGYMTVADQTEREAITTERRKQGMAVFQNDTNEMYVLQGGTSNSDWNLFTGGGSGNLQATMNLGSTATGLTSAVTISTDQTIGLQSTGLATSIVLDSLNDIDIKANGGNTLIRSLSGDVRLQSAQMGTPNIGDAVVARDTNGGIQWAPGVQTKKVTLSSADILSLHTTPVDLIPAPGPGKIINFINLISYYDFNTTAYTTTNSQSNIQMKFAGATSTNTTSIAQKTMLESTSDQYGAINNFPGFPFVINTSTVLPNAAMQASIPALSPVTLGDSPIHVYLQYMIIDL